MEDDNLIQSDDEPPDSDSDPPQSRSSVVLTAAPKSRDDLPSVPRFGFCHTSVVPAVPATDVRSARFASSARSRAFRRRFFAHVTHVEWNSWQWQLANRLVRWADVERVLVLDEDERMAFEALEGKLSLAITPYYASLLDRDDPLQPLRRSVVPTMMELHHCVDESDDPLGEDADSPIPGIVHRYPDRVLFLVSGVCAAHCRYCTRSRLVGHRFSRHVGRRVWDRALEYIEATPSVRDVLLSGGDPLVLSDDMLAYLLSRLRGIPHVEIVRIGTKVPVVMPQRITTALTRMLRRYHPLFMSIHFTHPDELTPENALACERLADAGIPMGSQTVLLAGINDDVTTMTRLMHGLLKQRVRPYYLYQCDPISGSAHFRTPVAKGLEIIRGMRGFTSGYAVPTYVIDAPGGGGKIPLLPEYVVGRTPDSLVLSNFEGREFRYPDAMATIPELSGPTY